MGSVHYSFRSCIKLTSLLFSTRYVVSVVIRRRAEQTVPASGQIFSQSKFSRYMTSQKNNRYRTVPSPPPIIFYAVYSLGTFERVSLHIAIPATVEPEPPVSAHFAWSHNKTDRLAPAPAIASRYLLNFTKFKNSHVNKHCTEQNPMRVFFLNYQSDETKYRYFYVGAPGVRADAEKRNRGRQNETAPQTCLPPKVLSSFDTLVVSSLDRQQILTRCEKLEVRGVMFPCRATPC